MDLVDFLLARIEEDQLTAQAAIAGSPDWRAHGGGPGRHRAVEDDAGEAVVQTGDEAPSVHQAAHIARWDPARVLAECVVKRRILRRFKVAHIRAQGLEPDGPAAEAALLGALKDLARPYAGHPDYRPEWRV